MTEEVNEEQISPLKQQLLAGPVNVTFTKADGTERTMLCTLNSEFLPPQPNTDQLETLADAKPARKPNPDVQVAWDIEKNAWRSFRIDSIKKIEYTTSEALSHILASST